MQAGAPRSSRISASMARWAFPQVDFKVTDPVADRPDGADGQIERSLPLAPACCRSARTGRRRRTGRARRSASPPTPSCFAAFVTVQKLSPRCLALWRARTRARAPAAVLLFSPSARRRARRAPSAARGHGIEPARVRVRAARRRATLRDRYALVDLVLDTLPYTGGDTTLRRSTRACRSSRAPARAMPSG